MAERDTDKQTTNKPNAPAAAGNPPPAYDPNYAGPQPNPGPPPTHDESLGAIQGAPREVAEEYARTGKTPKRYADEVQRAVRADAATGEGKKGREFGMSVDPGTAGQPLYPEDAPATDKRK
jgi:hypothetical protein